MNKKDVSKEPAGKKEEPVKETEKKEAEKEKEETPKKEPQKEDRTAELEAKIASLEAELKAQKDQFLRMAAEYDNYRKRTDRERTGIYSDATADAVSKFLPVADNLERALAQENCGAEDLRKGVELVNKQLTEALTKLGVAAMGEAGEAFDPALHNAVSHIEDEKQGENVVATVFQKGYRMGDKVVRHAMVQVAN